MTVDGRIKPKILTVISFLLFPAWSVAGFFAGRNFSFSWMLDNFGEPVGEQVFFYGTVTALMEIAFFFLGIPITFITMHQIGRRFKVAVGKPTLYGFLLYLLTLLVLILNYNRTH